MGDVAIDRVIETTHVPAEIAAVAVAAVAAAVVAAAVAAGCGICLGREGVASFCDLVFGS